MVTTVPCTQQADKNSSYFYSFYNFRLLTTLNMCFPEKYFRGNILESCGRVTI